MTLLFPVSFLFSYFLTFIFFSLTSSFGLSVVALSAGDGGSGYLEGQCQGNTLKIILHSSKAMTDFSKVQWAAASSGSWAQSHGMHNCDDHNCRLTDNGKAVEISVPNSHGQFLCVCVCVFFDSCFPSVLLPSLRRSLLPLLSVSFFLSFSL